jgi:hypothetical protein
MMLLLRDARAEPNRAIVNLYNFAGEMLNQEISRDRLKRLAAQMDGFLFFLDPTQLFAGVCNITLDRQLSCLTEFADDVRTLRNVPLGQSISEAV